MVAQMIAVIREEADQRVVAIIPCFHCIKNPADTLVNITEFAIIPGTKHPCMRVVNILSPDSVIHPADLFVHQVGIPVTAHRIRHPIRIIHAIEGNGRCKRRMGSYKRHQPKIGTGIRIANLFHCTVCCPGFYPRLSRSGTHLGHVIHFRAFPHQPLNEIISRIFPGDERRIGITTPMIGTAIQFLAVQMHVVAQVFIPGGSVKLADAESTIAPVTKCTRQIGTTSIFHIL